MLAKLRPHLLLALIFLVLTLLQQYGFFAVSKLTIVPLTFGKYVGVYLFLLAATFMKGPRFRFVFLSLVMLLNFFQMCHLSYFGTQILPIEIWLFFTQYHEVTGALKEDVFHILVPLLFTVIPVMLGHLALKRIPTHYRWRGMEVLFCLYFIYNPARTYVTGNTWGRQPSTRELTGMNAYLTWSYFMGKILPHKLSAESQALAQNSSMELKVTATELKHWDKIILVQGESHTPNHMSLYGYERPTTPFLEQLKNDPSFHFERGLSSGVSTDISVAFFMNLGFGAAGAIKAAKGEHCLNRLAKSQGYSTHFLSSQSGQQLRYIAPYLCSNFLDEYQALEQVAPQTVDEQAAIDRHLLPVLQTVMRPGQKQFIILHQRGSHAPWNLRYTQEANHYQGKGNDGRVADYDNSMVEFDFFWRDLDKILNESKEKILVLFTSDHGQAVGENNRWGHGFIEPLSFEVPMFFKSYNAPLPEHTKDLPRFLTHYNLGLYLVQQFGYETSQSPLELPKDYVIYGNDIDGFAGKARVNFDDKGYTFIYSAQ